MDGKIKSFGYFIPKTFENGDYKVCPRHGLLDHCMVRTFKKSFLDTSRYAKKLKELGLSNGLIKTLCSRRPAQLRRIEELIHGVIDTMICGDSTIFLREENGKTLRYVIRKIYGLGSNSLKTLVEYWKEFGRYLLGKANGVPVRISNRNFFLGLAQIPQIARIGPGCSKASLTLLSCLLSSRQFPAGDKFSEEAAVRLFKERLQTPSHVPREHVAELYETARLVGSYCRGRAEELKIGLDTSHISVSSSGDFHSSVLDGGRANTINDEIRKILVVAPRDDEKIPTPWGTLFCQAGVQRWRCWFREPRYDHFIRGERAFGVSPAEVEGETFIEGDPRWSQESIPLGGLLPSKYVGKADMYQGFDDHLGQQILACAWISRGEYKGMIPMRIACVNEPGYKSRVVTMTNWWNNVLQQSISHPMITALSLHPWAEPGLSKSNQAWNVLYYLHGRKFPPETEVVCTDLTASTDLIPFEVSKALLRGFLDGLGKDTTLVDLVGPRALVGEDLIFTLRGIMMGEPLAKPTLTLQQLCCSIIAYKRVYGSAVMHLSAKDILVNIGGDDIIMIALKAFHDAFFGLMDLCEAIISKDKTTGFKRVVRYCEKLLFVPALLNKDLLSVYKDYENSPWVESPKVRLLSPTSKTTEIRNDRNTALGKGTALGKELRYFPTTVFSHKQKSFVRDRFIQRMGSLLPVRGTTTFWHLLLPPKFGGLGLWQESDLEDLANYLGAPSRYAILNWKTMGRKERKKFSAMPTNSYYRGYALDVEEYEPIFGQILTANGLFTSFESKTFKVIKAELLKSVGPGSDLIMAKRALLAGWLTYDQIVDKLMRPVLFTGILGRTVESKPFNTLPLKFRFAKLWEEYDGYDAKLTPEVLVASFNAWDEEKFYNLDKTMQSWDPVLGASVNTKLIDMISGRAPTLDIQLNWKPKVPNLVTYEDDDNDDLIEV